MTRLEQALLVGIALLFFWRSVVHETTMQALREDVDRVRQRQQGNVRDISAQATLIENQNREITGLNAQIEALKKRNTEVANAYKASLDVMARDSLSRQELERELASITGELRRQLDINQRLVEEVKVKNELAADLDRQLEQLSELLRNT